MAKGKHKFLTFIIFFAVIAGATGFIANLQNNSIQKEVSGVKDETEYITLEEYNKIKTNMSYEEVIKIVGSNGTVTSEVEMNGINNKIITWYGNGVAGSNANVTFMNGKVQGKAQVGLK